MRGNETYGNNFHPVLLAGVSSYSQGAVITLNENITEFAYLFFQFGTPGNNTGYETVPAFGWRMGNLTVTQPNISMTTHGVKVLMTIDSNTQITYTSGSIALRGIWGIRK